MGIHAQQSYVTGAIDALNTDAIEEGATNLYFTSQRALDATAATIASASAAAVSYADSLDTDDVAEGSNLYFTSQRALDASLSTITSASAAAVSSANSYADSAVSSLVDSAPATLNTLNELAAALGDDANFSTTVTNTLANKLDISSASSIYITQTSASTIYAPLASPTLTGVPAAPTAAAGTNTTQLATTAFVQNSANTVVIDTKTDSYTLLLTDAGETLEMNSASANTVTIPLNSSVAFEIGTTIDIIQYGAGQTTIVATGGVTIRSKDGNLKLSSQYSGATLYKRGTDEWVVVGDLTS